MLATDIRTSLLVNLVAINLLRQYGVIDSVYFYNHGVEVDFFIPEDELAIYVCYNTKNEPDTLDREVTALTKKQKPLPCARMLIITYDEKDTI